MALAEEAAAVAGRPDLKSWVATQSQAVAEAETSPTVIADLRLRTSAWLPLSEPLEAAVQSRVERPRQRRRRRPFDADLDRPTPAKGVEREVAMA